MRRRGWVAIGLFGVGLLLGLLERQTGARGLLVLSGLFEIGAVILAVSLLPLWDRLGWRLPPAGRLFVRPGGGETWSAREGKPVAAERKRRQAVATGPPGRSVGAPPGRPPGEPRRPRPGRRK